MAPAPTDRAPGSMTVSILFGWQHILVGLVLLVVLAAVFGLVLAAGRGRQAEWQAFLDSRSSGPAPDGDDVPADAPRGISRPRPR